MWKFLKDIAQALFWQPIRGNNGITQLDELGKYIVIWITTWMIIYEGLLEGSQFTDPQFIAVLSLLAGIIGVQLYFKNKKNE